MLKLVELHMAKFFSVPLQFTFLNSNNACHQHGLENRVCLLGISRTHKQLCGHGQTSSKCKGGGHKCGSHSEYSPQIHVLCVLGPESYLPGVRPVLASFSSFCCTENQHVCLKLHLLSIVIWKERLLLMKVAN